MKFLALIMIAFSSTAGAMSPIPKNENIADLLEGRKEIKSLNEIERLSLNAAKTNLDLWSGHYWPLFQGGLAIRYRDPSFINLMTQKVQFDKFKELAEKKPLYTYSGKENLLSAAEKYDLIVGDTAMGLTQYSWKNSQKYETLGKVPLWRGICDGWSSAVQKMPRPVRSVTLNTPAGTPITFYPEDIKALGSLLYARAQSNVIFLGKRCRGELLSVFTGACEGTNPGAFHQALINRVGVLKKTFIADVSSSKEVWNYPVKSYKISYYNVFTDEESTRYMDSAEPFKKKGQFHKGGRRHEKTSFIVGVKAEVSYANMRVSNLLDTDSVLQDEDLVKTYYYDLELDRDSTILGGEWFGDTMPDFIWAPNDVTYPLSVAEASRLPQTLDEIARFAKVASKEGQPLSIIVQKLFELAK